MSNPFSLAGKVALVTGPNTGLGQGMALALAEAGADIAGAGSVPPVETEVAVKKMGRRFLSIDANLSTIEPVERIVAETVQGLGGIDILVNNAGLIRRADALDFSEKGISGIDVMNVNIKAAFFMSQAAGREMVKKGKGKIINIASMLSFQGGIRVPSYTASKSGIAGITRLLANEWASKGINSNAIAPGYMATANTAAQLRVRTRIAARRYWGGSRLGAGACRPIWVARSSISRVQHRTT